MPGRSPSSEPHLLLDPLSLLYGWAAERRRAWFDAGPWRRRGLRQPVVSVGNLAVGGRGKTPMVRHVAALLRDGGERPAILSRGYARREPAEGVVVVSDGRHLRADLERAGDEPLMLARSLDGVAVMVAADRHLAGRVAEARLGATVHVLDDGFQHLGLRRDLDVLLVTAADLQNGRVLPAGRLRERATTATRADAWLAPASDVTVVAELAAAAGMPRVFAVKGAAGALRWADPFGAPVLTPPRRVVAVAAIAWPERFVGALAEAGFDVMATHTWGDHHVFTSEDGGVVRDLMRRANAELVVTTEKDAVRWLRRRPWSFPLAWLSWSVTAEPSGEFREWLVERVARARAPRS